MKRISLYLITLSIIYSCGTIDKYTVNRIDELSKSQFEIGKQYVFENAAFGYFNSDKFVLYDTTENDNYATIWSHIEPKYIKKDSLLYKYKTSIELKSNNKIHFKLIDSLGNTKREITKKYSRRNNYIQYSVNENEFYFLVNTLDLATIYLYLDNQNNLIATSDGGRTGFFIIIPVGAAGYSTTQKYKNIINNP